MLETTEKQRVAIPFTEPENIVFKYGGIDVKIKPYLSQAEQISLINLYVKEYFFPLPGERVISAGKNNLFEAEYKLTLSLIHYATNIDIVTLNDDSINSTTLLSDIKENLVNYYDFEEKLYTIVKDIQREFDIQKQLGYVVDEISNKIVLLFDKVSNMDTDQLLKEGRKLIEEMNNSEIVKAITEESDKYSKIKKEADKK